MAPRPHLVLTLGRSGSNYLTNAINQSPDAVNFGEVLGAWTLPQRVLAKGPWRRPDRLLDALYDSPVAYGAMMAGGNLVRLRNKRPLSFPSRGRLRTLGVKDFSLNFENRGIPAYPIERDDLLVVGLRRRNTLHRVLSGHTLSRTQQAVRTDEKAEAPRIELDVDAVLRDLDVYAREEEALEKTLSAVPASRLHRLTYEDLFASADSRRNALEGVFSFLGLPYEGEESDHKKMSAAPLPERFSNFDALRRRLGGTPYAALAEE